MAGSPSPSPPCTLWPPWELPDSPGCEEDPQPAPAHVLLPVHAGAHRCGHTLSTMPTTLAVLLFDYWLIGFNACLVQMFFLHSISVVESSVLLAMSFDCFVAISTPLRYAAVLTNNILIRIWLAIVARATLCLFPVPFLVKHLNFCPGGNILSNSFCFYSDVMRWACADIRINICYELYVVVSIGGIDSLLIILSYTFILHTVMGLATPRECIRALSTCVFHILAVFVFFFQVSPCP